MPASPPRRPTRPRALAAIAAIALLAAIGGALVARSGSAQRYRAPASTAALVAAVRDAVPAALGSSRTPGAAVAVVRDGRLAWAGGFGRADADRREPVTGATVFQAGSLSKTVTAWSVLRPAARRMLPLDAPLVDLVRPWPLGRSRFDARGVTVRRLLSHTAGVDVAGYLGDARPGRLPSTWDTLRGTDGTAATRVRGGRAEAPAGPVRLVAPPGSGYSYSGGGYSLLQYAIERRSRLPFAVWAARTTLRPLAMDDSRFGWPAPRPGRDTAPRDRAGRRLATAHDIDGRPLGALRYPELAAAGLATSARDLGRFLLAVLRDPSGMERPQPATDGHYGLGLEIRRLRDDDVLLWHEGVNRGWHARLLLLPRHRLGIAILTNGDGGGAVADAVERLVVR